MSHACGKKELFQKPGQCGVAIFHREMADLRLDEMTGELGRDGEDRKLPISLHLLIDLPSQTLTAIQ